MVEVPAGAAADFFSWPSGSTGIKGGPISAVFSQNDKREISEKEMKVLRTSAILRASW